jgi:hypothetical protein
VKQTRRQFLKVGSLTGPEGPSRSALQSGGSWFQRETAPRVRAWVPEGWHSSSSLVTDLVEPVDLMTISSASIDPRPSRQESGLPDLSVQPQDSALVWLSGQDLSRVPGQAEGLRGPRRLRFSDLSSAGEWNDPGFHRRRQVYVGGKYVYALRVWIGEEFRETDTIRSVIESIEIEW